MESLLKVEGLSVGYRTYRGSSRVLDNLDIEVAKGEKVGVVGETGCGKTTLLRSILRILPPNAIVYSGKVFFKDVSMLDVSKDTLNKVRRESIGIIFQDPMSALNPFLRVRDQLHDAINYSKMFSDDKGLRKEDIREISIRLLKEVALPDPERILDSYPFQLSGGMRQRVCIALALTRANELLLADEPTTNLDVTIQEQVLNLLRDLVNERKLSVILVSHALGMLSEFVDRVYVMYAGQIAEVGRTEEVFNDPLHPYTRALVSSAPKLTGRWEAEALFGRVPDYINPPQGCRFQSRCKYFEVRKPRCTLSRPPLQRISETHWVACYNY
ncbi:MAG: ABC transporter ATP-binding protein [Candidatus Korarchaeum sp.]|nr:ABC transporter ATP-binding protein [Candidatus Korarchaeum sp.]MDW8034922.1 ABC transporter ATP-binding protein [Candidatus Korarchaeum sp.]